MCVFILSHTTHGVVHDVVCIICVSFGRNLYFSSTGILSSHSFHHFQPGGSAPITMTQKCVAGVTIFTLKVARSRWFCASTTCSLTTCSLTTCSLTTDRPAFSVSRWWLQNAREAKLFLLCRGTLNEKCGNDPLRQICNLWYWAVQNKLNWNVVNLLSSAKWASPVFPALLDTSKHT